MDAGTTERETGRVEAFSDGVLAVIITIMAFELKAPVGAGLVDLKARAPELLVYLLSFTFVGIYWNNHHHLLRTATSISGWVMWANLHLLFWLSLIPVLTEWMAQYWRHTAPAASYSAVALGCGVAFTLLQVAIIRADGGRDSPLAQRLGRDLKGPASLGIYALALGLAFVSPIISYVLFASVAFMWWMPDPRLERAVDPSDASSGG